MPDQFGVGRRNGLRELLTAHPVDAHCAHPVLQVPPAPRLAVLATSSARMSVDTDGRLRVVTRKRHQGRAPGELEPAMPAHFEAEHRAAEDDIRPHLCSRYVLDHP